MHVVLLWGNRGLTVYYSSNHFILFLSIVLLGVRMNGNQSNMSLKCVRDTSVTAVVFPCLYSALFLFALVLNCLAAWIFFNIRSTTTFVVYLKNVVREPAIIFCDKPI